MTAVCVVLVLRAFRGDSLTVHSLVLGAIGAVVFASGGYFYYAASVEQKNFSATKMLIPFVL